MKSEKQALFYEAGYLARHLSWPDPDVIAASEIDAIKPVGGSCDGAVR